MGLGDWKIVQSLLRDHGDDKQSCMRNAMVLEGWRGQLCSLGVILDSASLRGG